MKIIFLDIDGVLNSTKYDRERKQNDGNIDITRLALLKRLVDSTNAKIVLTSTWRKFWESDKKIISKTGAEIDRVFASQGLEIFDKTPFFGERKDEISAWLNKNNNIDAFCIIDDISFGWEELSPFVITTNPHIGRGFEEKHLRNAVELLNGR